MLAVHGMRYALTVWYYDKTERMDAAKQAAESGRGSKVAVTSPAAQREAKEFIALLMGGSEVAEDGGEPTEEELRSLGAAVTQLTEDALFMVARCVYV